MKRELLIIEDCLVEFYAFKLKDWEKFLKNKSAEEIKNIQKQLNKEIKQQERILNQHIHSLRAMNQFLKKEKDLAKNSTKISQIEAKKITISRNASKQLAIAQKIHRIKAKAS